MFMCRVEELMPTAAKVSLEMPMRTDVSSWACLLEELVEGESPDVRCRPSHEDRQINERPRRRRGSLRDLFRLTPPRSPTAESSGVVVGGGLDEAFQILDALEGRSRKDSLDSLYDRSLQVGLTKFEDKMNINEDPMWFDEHLVPQIDNDVNLDANCFESPGDLCSNQDTTSDDILSLFPYPLSISISQPSIPIQDDDSVTGSSERCHTPFASILRPECGSSDPKILSAGESDLAKEDEPSLDHDGLDMSVVFLRVASGVESSLTEQLPATDARTQVSRSDTSSSPASESPPSKLHLSGTTTKTTKISTDARRRSRTNSSTFARSRRRRRASITLVKPKIFRRGAGKTGKSPTRTFFSGAGKNGHFAKRRRKESESKSPTNTLPVDHQSLCKFVGEPGSKPKHPQRSLTFKSLDHVEFPEKHVTSASKTAKGRAHLNIIERQRRLVLAQAMERLREELPMETASEEERKKLSKLEILRGATEFVLRLRDEESALVEEKKKLREEQKQLAKRLNLLKHKNGMARNRFARIV